MVKVNFVVKFLIKKLYSFLFKCFVLSIIKVILLKATKTKCHQKQSSFFHLLNWQIVDYFQKPLYDFLLPLIRFN